MTTTAAAIAEPSGPMLRQAISLHQQGQFDGAEQLYSHILQVQQDHFDALHLLGVLMHQRGRNHEAVKLITKALAVNAQFADAHANQGHVLAALERNEEALACCDRTLALNPRHFNALILRGKLLLALQRHGDALASFQRAVSLQPNNAEAHYYRGVAQQEVNASGIVLKSLSRDAAPPAHYAGFYINLDRSPARRTEIDAEIARHRLQHLYRRFPAADGNVFGLPNPRLTDSEMGCFASHLLLLKQNAAGKTHLHVVEDDTIFSRFAAQMVESVVASDVIDRFDILFTESCIMPLRRDYQKCKMLFDKSVERDAAGNVTGIHPTIINYVAGTTSYIVNYRSIPRLLALLTRALANGAPAPIDLVIRSAAGAGALRVGCLFPFVTAFRIDSIIDNTIAGRQSDQRSRLMVDLARHSFFVECDHKALRECAMKLFPEQTPNAHEPSMPDDDAHGQFLDGVLDFCRTEKFVQF